MQVPLAHSWGSSLVGPLGEGMEGTDLGAPALPLTLPLSTSAKASGRYLALGARAEGRSSLEWAKDMVSGVGQGGGRMCPRMGGG